MRKHAGVILDTAGNVVNSASVTVYLTGTTTKATLYSNEGVTQITNPVTSDTNGRFSFYVADGKYDLKVSGSNLTTYTISDVQIVDTYAHISAKDPHEVLAAVYPVGSIYISTLATNPATLFGFGTWVAFGAGKTLVGLDAGQTEFDTVEETGGAKTHTLSVAELAVHTHVQNAHGHALEDPSQSLTTSNIESESADLFQTLYDTVSHGNYKNQIQSTTAENQNTGSGSAHNNLQPYIVVYMWKRTA